MTAHRSSRAFIAITFAATALAAWAVSTAPGHAAKCKVLSDNQCQSDGQSCDPPKGGKCVTHHSRAEFTCKCETSSRSSDTAPGVDLNIGIGFGGGGDRRRDDRRDRDRERGGDMMRR